METALCVVSIIIAGSLFLLICRYSSFAAGNALGVKIIKGCEGCILPGVPEGGGPAVIKKWPRAGVWIPDRDIRIWQVSIAEQSEIAIYADIEVSRSPNMLTPDDDMQIFRYKYAGPAVRRDPPSPVEYSGSNTTTSSISFSPNWISVKAGTPIWVHMEIYNWSPQEIGGMSQDVTIYYTFE